MISWTTIRADSRIRSQDRGRRGARPGRREEGEYIDVFNRRATQQDGMDRRPNPEVIFESALRRKIFLKNYLVFCLAFCLSPACQSREEEECSMVNSDCLCNGSLGSTTSRCSNLRRISHCAPVSADKLCTAGTACEFTIEDCHDVCIENSTYSAQCGLEGISRDGSGGIAVGYTSVGMEERPAVLLTHDFGETWHHEVISELPEGCDGLRFEQVWFSDASTGWIRFTGEGAECRPGLFYTSDGGASWSRFEFPTTTTGEIVGGGHLHIPAKEPSLAPGIVLSSGTLPGVSMDHGETWEPLPQPEDDWPTGTEAPVEIGHFAVLDDGIHLCVSSAPSTVQGAIYCGPTDGSIWKRAFQFDGPVLAMAEAPSGKALWAIVAGPVVKAVLLSEITGELESYDLMEDAQPDSASIQILDAKHGVFMLNKESVSLGYWLYSPSYTDLKENDAWLTDGTRIQAVFMHAPTRLWLAAESVDGFADIRFTPGRYLSLKKATVEGQHPGRWMGVAVGVSDPKAPVF